MIFKNSIWIPYSFTSVMKIICWKGIIQAWNGKKKLLYIFVYSYKKWVSMTTYLSSELLHELQPLCGTIASRTRFETKSSNTKSRREEAEAHKHTCSKVKRTPEVLEQYNCLFVLRFYGPVIPVGSCRARSVYLTTRLLDRLSPLSG